VSYPQQGGYPQQPYSGTGSGGGTNPATAVIAALLALAVTAFQIIYLVKFFGQAPISIGDLPTEYLITLGAMAVGGLLTLLGAMFALFRKSAGAVLIVLGAIVAVVSVFLPPLLFTSRLSGKIDFGTYLQGMFQFGDTFATVEALTVICGPLALIFAILPSTLRHLRGSRADSTYGDPYQNQQQAYPQAGYNSAPNSGGFPQQDYPGYQPQQGQQGGYPQQQQGGGQPPQQQGW